VFFVFFVATFPALRLGAFACHFILQSLRREREGLQMALEMVGEDFGVGIGMRLKQIADGGA
jgi:hypothetical protein